MRCSPDATLWAKPDFTYVIDTAGVRRVAPKWGAEQPRSSESSALDACQRTGQHVSDVDTDFLTKRNGEHEVSAGARPPRFQEAKLWAVLRTNGLRILETAFHDKKGHIVVEAVAAKICRRVVHVVHEVLGRQRGISLH